tara:strand:+ start:243 stop:1001 length:759 start_codon:yes stop_codon:yes gene_type:complete
MKKIILVLTIIFTFSFNILKADDHIPTIGAMEMFACNYNKSKDISDSMKVVEEWNEYIDSTEVSYSAWILEPYYTNPEEQYDSYWIGFSQSFEEMGLAQETMFTDEGIKLDEKFAKVSTCEAHSLWGFQSVRENKDPFGDGFLAASRCKLMDDATPQMIMAADVKWNEFMDSSGMSGGIFRWYAGPGVSSEFSDDYDFVNINTIDSLSAFGAGADINVNGGGNMVAASIYSELMQCEDMRVYTAKVARAPGS